MGGNTSLSKEGKDSKALAVVVHASFYAALLLFLRQNPTHLLQIIELFGNRRALRPPSIELG